MPITFDAALNQIANADQSLNFRTVDVRQIQPIGLHQLFVGRSYLELNEHATELLRRLVGFPEPLVNRLRPRTVENVVTDLWTEIQCSENQLSSLVIATRDDCVKSIVKSGLAAIPNSQIVDVLRSCIPSREFESAQVRSFQLTEHGSFEIGFTFPIFAIEPRIGDIVQAGLHISHSPTGDEATRVAAKIFRLRCRNGMLVPVCLGNKSLRVRRNARCNDDREVLERFRIVLVTCFNQLKDKLNEINNLASTKADPDPIAELRRIATLRRFNQGTTEALLHAYENDEMGTPGDTRYDVLAALSRVATHGGLDSRQQNELLRYSGVYSQGDHARRCPYCKSVMRDLTYVSSN